MHMQVDMYAYIHAYVCVCVYVIPLFLSQLLKNNLSCVGTIAWAKIVHDWFKEPFFVDECENVMDQV